MDMCKSVDKAGTGSYNKPIKLVGKRRLYVRSVFTYHASVRTGSD